MVCVLQIDYTGHEIFSHIEKLTALYGNIHLNYKENFQYSGENMGQFLIRLYLHYYYYCYYYCCYCCCYYYYYYYFYCEDMTGDCIRSNKTYSHEIKSKVESGVNFTTFSLTHNGIIYIASFHSYSITKQ